VVVGKGARLGMLLLLPLLPLPGREKVGMLSLPVARRAVVEEDGIGDR
jgi:hypothetical protein